MPNLIYIYNTILNELSIEFKLLHMNYSLNLRFEDRKIAFKIIERGNLEDGKSSG